MLIVLRLAQSLGSLLVRSDETWSKKSLGVCMLITSGERESERERERKKEREEVMQNSQSMLCCLYFFSGAVSPIADGI